MNKIVIFLICIFSGYGFTQVEALKTPRLLSMGGASAAALLVEESAFANPSSIAFNQTSSFYYQRTNFDILGEPTGTSKGPTNANAFVLSDSSGPVKGNISFQQQKNFGFERTRLTSTIAGISDGTRSFGVLYRYTKDKNFVNGLDTKNTFHQLVFGMTQIFSDTLTFGAYVTDPFKSNPKDALAAFGLQYVFLDQFYILGDVEGNYLKSYSETLTWKIGAQIHLFDNFYFRAGKYNNKNLNIEGTGWGLSWNGPNLGLNFGVGTSRKLDLKKSSLIQDSETYQEASMSISVKV